MADREFALPGLTRTVSRTPSPAPFATDVPVFLGTLERAGAERFTPVTSAAEFAAKFGTPQGFLAYAVAGFFANGGQRAYIGGLPARDRGAPLAEHLAALRDRPDIDLVCAPDLVYEPDLQRRIADHLASGAPQFAILDAPSAVAADHPAADACAVYGPLVLVPCLECSDGTCPGCRAEHGHGTRLVPPSGFVAGTFARVGPGLAPANIRLEGVLDVDPFAPAGAGNRVLVQAGRGVRVWGARTVGGRDIGARRLLQTIERWSRRTLEAVAFEPNTPALGLRVRRDIEALLRHLHSAGLLAGASPAEAFLVVCDERNNPRPVRDGGELIVDVRVHPCRTVTQVDIHLVRVDGRVTVAVDSP